MEAAGWTPGDMVGSSSERLVGRVAATQYGHCGAVQDCETVGQTGPTCGMSIFIPPAVFEKEVAVFDLPMIADMRQQLCGRDPRGIEACQKVARVVRHHLAIDGELVAVDAQSDPAARKSQLVADIVGVTQGEPEPAAICQSPLFSCVSAAGGRCSA